MTATAPEPTSPIPAKASVTHNEFLEAIGPLLELLNLDPMSMLTYLHVTDSDSDDALLVIHAGIAARAAGHDDDKSYPRGLIKVDGVAPGPQEHSELFWPVTIRVV